MTTKKLKKLGKKIKKSNKKFRRATPEQKRVLIAKDVLKELAAESFITINGRWVVAEQNIVTEKELEDNAQLSVALKRLPQCEVCAIGGMFIAAVKRYNKIQCQGLFDPYSCSALGYSDYTHSETAALFGFLEKFFTPKQLSMIEVAYEGDAAGSNTSILSQNERDKVLEFHSNNGNACEMPDDTLEEKDEKRIESKLCMKAIMENIVDNGEFAP